MEQFLKYYTLDWVAMILSLLAVYLLGNKNKNVTWVFLGFGFILTYKQRLTIFYKLTNDRLGYRLVQHFG
jgi:serine protease inhibitor ecotin